MAITTIDFESDNNGALFAGDTADSFLFDDFTITGVSNSPSGISNEAMIFDSENPTGGDSDLTTATQGNVLIISEDGDSADPDDEAAGGTITFDFNEPVDIHSIFVVDASEGGAVFEAFDSDGASLGTVVLSPEGDAADGKQENVVLDFEGASKLVATFNESGAIDDLVYETKEPDKEFEVEKDISNIVLYLDCGDNDVFKFKIDDFEGGLKEISLSELEMYLDKTEYGDCDILGLTIKAGDNKGGFGPGEGQFFDADETDSFVTGTKDKADIEVSASDFFMDIA